MTNLEPRADKVVREAVDAFMDGRLIPDFFGETVFETKNSRYRLLDGVVFSAPDASLVGAELVGWLCESSRRCLVESAWEPGSRAVLVDRAHGRNIIVTSTTRLLHAEEPGSGLYQGGSVKSHSEFRSWHPPPRDNTPLPSFSPLEAPIVASTPPPVGVSLSSLPPPPARPSVPPPPRTPVPPPPVPVLPAPFASAATPLPSSAKSVHLPPRPIAPRPSPARPLPLPVPPPRRESPVPAATAAPLPVAPGALRMPSPPRISPEIEEAGDWELTSAELEIEPHTNEPATLQRAHDNSTQHDASCYPADAELPDVPFELSRPRTVDVEAANAEPFPLVRPIDPGALVSAPTPPLRR
ncbi:MAG: hypothetical protein QM820_60505 [Minicystis sp.]